MLSVYKTLFKLKFLKAILLFIIAINFISCNLDNKKPEIIATVNYKSIGCFGGETGSLKITSTDGKMSAVLMLNKTRYSTTVDSNKIQALNKFIKELKMLDHNTACTTKDFYSVKIRNEKFEIQDFGCSWNGFDTLKYALFHREMEQRLNSYNN
ncbi:MAG: hypothetical protein ABI675_12335 [Chitinophagaceae bacterium]